MKRVVLACTASLLALTAQAAEVVISKPWVKGTLASARSSTAYMEFLCDEAGSIVAAHSPLASSVSLQDMRFELDGGPLRPTPVKTLPFEKRRKLQLTPVSGHLVLQGLSGPVKAGDRIPLILTLRLADGSEQEVTVEAIGRGVMP